MSTKKLLYYVLPTATDKTGIGRYINELVKLSNSYFEASVHNSPYSGRSIGRYIYQFLVLPLRSLAYAIFNQYTIIITEEGLSYLAPFCLFRCAVVVHHVPKHYTSTTILSKAKSIYLSINLGLARRCNLIICPSETTRRQLLAMDFNADKIIVVPNLFSHEAVDTQAIGRSLNDISQIDDARLVLLLVAGDEPRKRIDVAIHCAALLRDLRPIVLKVGRPVDMESRQHSILLAHQLHVDIVFLQDLSPSQLIECYKRSNILLCTSEHEGFCRPIVESQAHCLPVIARDIDVLREVGGEDGVLYVSTQGDAKLQGQEFANAVRHLVGSPLHKQSLIEAGLLNKERYLIDSFKNSPGFTELIRRLSHLN